MNRWSDLASDSSDSEDEYRNKLQESTAVGTKKKKAKTRKKHVVYTGGGRKSVGGKWVGGGNRVPSNVTEVTVDPSVVLIEAGALSGCKSLTTVNIPEGVEYIAEGAFRDCSELATINIPESIDTIPYAAFYGCTSLATIVIPQSVKSIGKNAFYECESLTSVSIPTKVKSINDFTFYGCTSLVNVSLPKLVKTIGKQAFFRCSSLNAIHIPESVTSIGDGAFFGCSSLVAIHIPLSVRSIGREAFIGCSSLSIVTIVQWAESGKTIGSNAFPTQSKIEYIIESKEPSSKSFLDALTDDSTDHTVENLDERKAPAPASESGKLLKDEILPLLYEDENESGELTFFEAVGEGSSSGSTTLHEWKVLKRIDTGKTYYYNMDLVKLVGVDVDSLETVRGSIFAVKAVDQGFGISPILRLKHLLRLQHDLEESKRSSKGSVTIKNTQVSDKARDSVLDYITALLQKSSFDSHTILDAMVLPDDTPGLKLCLPLDFFYGNSGGINLSTTTSPLNGVVACVEVSSGTSSATSEDGGGNLMAYHKIHAMHLGAPFTFGGIATAYATAAAGGSTPGVNVAAPLAMASSSMATAGSASGGSASGSTRFGTTSTAGGATPGGPGAAGGPPSGQGQGFSLFEKSKKFLRSPKIRNRTDDPWFAVRVFSKHVEETFNTLTEFVAKLNIGADIAGAANIGAETEARRTSLIERVSREVMTAAQRATTHGIPPMHDHSITHKPPHHYCLCTRDVTTLPHTVAVWSKLELHEDIGTDVYIVSSSHPAATEPLFGRAVYDESSIMQVVLNLAFGNQLRGLIGDRATTV